MKIYGLYIIIERVFQIVNILENISRFKKILEKTHNKNAIYLGLAALLLLLCNYGSKMLVAITTWNSSTSIMNLSHSLHMYAYF